MKINSRNFISTMQKRGRRGLRNGPNRVMICSYMQNLVPIRDEHLHALNDNKMKN